VIMYFFLIDARRDYTPVLSALIYNGLTNNTYFINTGKENVTQLTKHILGIILMLLLIM